MRSTTTTVSIAVSTAVPHTSPSPWRAARPRCDSIAPATLTPKYAVTPARSSGVSMLPPWAAGMMLIGPRPPAGATPTVPSIGSSGRSTVRSLWRGGEPAGAGGPVDLVHPDPLLQGGVQHRRGCAWWSAPRSAGTSRHPPVPGRDDRHEVHGQGVAGLGALDQNGPVTGLRYGKCRPRWAGPPTPARRRRSSPRWRARRSCRARRSAPVRAAEGVRQSSRSGAESTTQLGVASSACRPARRPAQRRAAAGAHRKTRSDDADRRARRSRASARRRRR